MRALPPLHPPHEGNPIAAFPPSSAVSHRCAAYAPDKRAVCSPAHTAHTRLTRAPRPSQYQAGVRVGASDAALRPLPLRRGLRAVLSWPHPLLHQSRRIPPASQSRGSAGSRPRPKPPSNPTWRKDLRAARQSPCGADPMPDAQRSHTVR